MNSNLVAPRVSVIVPNFNHAYYLKERLISILTQTYQNFELILLDDASTDDSLAVIRDCLSGHSHQLVVNEKNSGSTFQQWNRGISLARGEFIWIAESDDVADPSLLERLVIALDRSDAVYAYCQSLCIDTYGEVFGYIKGWTDDYTPHLWASDFVIDGNFFCVSFMAIKCVIPNASAVLFRRESYINPYTILPDFQLSGDYLLWAEMAMGQKVAYVATPLNRYRFHPGTVRMAKRPTYFRECVACTNHILERTSAWDQPSQLVFLRRHLLALWLMIGLEPASPLNWWKYSKAYKLLYRLHGPLLFFPLLKAFPRSLWHSLVPFWLFISLGSTSFLRKLRNRFS